MTSLLSISGRPQHRFSGHSAIDKCFMNNGKPFLTMSSWSPTFTVWSSRALMGLRGASIRAFLFILLIILKSLLSLISFDLYCISETCFRVLAASIRNLGSCPCPRCHIKLSDIHKLGMRSDRAQRSKRLRTDDEDRRDKVKRSLSLIYDRGHTVDSTAVESLLQEHSWVPTNVRSPYSDSSCGCDLFPQNAFSERLSTSGFDLYRMFLPDIMHEFDEGIWRSTFIHLLRVLSCVTESLLYKLNHR